MAFIEHFPVLIVVVPLLAAPLCILFNHSRLAWGLSMLAAGFTLVAALVLLQMLQHTDALS